jgi:hypothetical protein
VLISIFRLYVKKEENKKYHEETIRKSQNVGYSIE